MPATDRKPDDITVSSADHADDRMDERMDDRDARSRTFEQEALRHLDDVARFALSLTHSQPDADDLVQETFLRAFRGWHTYRPGSDARRWLFTICKHVFLRTRERAERVVELDADPGLEAIAAARLHNTIRAAGGDDLFDRLDLAPAIERAIAALPEAFRVAVVLVDVEGYAYDEAAAVLEVPIGTVRSRLFRARRLLQEALFDHARDAGILGARPAAGRPEDT
jgi:RNA polymerase sigma-70 factor (ECF subfamily)